MKIFQKKKHKTYTHTHTCASRLVWSESPNSGSTEEDKGSFQCLFSMYKIEEKGFCTSAILLYLFFFDFADYWLLVSGSQLNPTYSKILRNALCHFLTYKTAMLKLFVDFFQASP